MSDADPHGIARMVELVQAITTARLEHEHQPTEEPRA